MRLPVDFDLSDLVGNQIGQVCVDEFQVQMHFTGPAFGAHIQGGGKLILVHGEEESVLFDERWMTGAGLELVIGAHVSAWEKVGEYTFSLTLDSGVSLLFDSRQSEYENFWIQIGDEEFWVI